MIILGKFHPTQLRKQEIEIELNRFLRDQRIRYGECPYPHKSQPRRRHIHVYSPLNPPIQVPKKKDGWHRDYCYNTKTGRWEQPDRSDESLRWIIFWATEPTEVRNERTKERALGIRGYDVILVNNFREEHRAPLKQFDRWLAIVRNVQI